jgi:hypothetical protein
LNWQFETVLLSPSNGLGTEKENKMSKITLNVKGLEINFDSAFEAIVYVNDKLNLNWTEAKNQGITATYTENGKVVA